MRFLIINPKVTHYMIGIVYLLFGLMGLLGGTVEFASVFVLDTMTTAKIIGSIVGLLFSLAVTISAIQFLRKVRWARIACEIYAWITVVVPIIAYIENMGNSYSHEVKATVSVVGVIFSVFMSVFLLLFLLALINIRSKRFKEYYYQAVGSAESCVDYRE
ncbi:MAG: hypothetical protein R3F48_09455 [Candidatus Zixiibacteriota bacterium]